MAHPAVLNFVRMCMRDLPPMTRGPDDPIFKITRFLRLPDLPITGSPDLKLWLLFPSVPVELMVVHPAATDPLPPRGVFLDKSGSHERCRALFRSIGSFKF